ncbi:MAG: flagellar assembly peptidoglycan hydrolase FlgJ [Betaproteobacteria bacterium]
MSIAATSSNALAADAKSLNALKLQAGQATPAAIKEAAKQFESLFMRELIKSMRDATMKSGMMDSAQGDLGADLLDQQLAVQMSGRPGGLSDSIARQLSQQMGVSAGPAAPPSVSGAAPANPPATTAPAAAAASVSQAGFVQRMSAVAAKVEHSSGIPAGFMIGQAGLESGWGRHEIRMADGSSSFNLFGIKAGPGWSGKVAEVRTTEYVNGQPQTTVAKFRAYDSHEASFRDYARLINQSPRYAQARQQTGSVTAYANGLQRAGYATDPAYASKLSQTINRTLQLQRAQT